MKNLNTIINIVLGIAVITLFVLHFKGNSTSSIDAIDINDTTKVAVVKPKITNNTLLKDAKVVYVNADSISKLCLYYKELEKTITSKRKKMEDTYGAQMKSLEAEYMGYQQRGASMTQEEMQQAQQSIQMKKQQIDQNGAKLQQTLEKEVMTLNKSIEGKITKFMDQYAKIKGYRFILTYGGGSNLLYANDSLDVSFEVINGLNNQYKAKK
jgi:outer membrane protein